MIIFNCPNCNENVKAENVAQVSTGKCKCKSCNAIIFFKKDSIIHMLIEVLSGGLIYFFAFVLLVTIPFIIPESFISFGWSFLISAIISLIILYVFEKLKLYINFKYRLTYKHIDI